ncbi:MAG: AAA family ATPase [Lachnospiraceae bacterium]
MIVMDLKVDNYYAFKNFHINMAYPKKIIDSAIDGEFLEDRTNFRYKKVNIIMGSNATGKTSIGRILMHIFNFISKKELEGITNAICNKHKEATFSIDFVLRDNKLYRLKTTIHPLQGEQYRSSEVDVTVESVAIKKTDSYESTAKRFSSYYIKENYINALEKIGAIGWFFTYPTDEASLNCKDADDDYLDILNYTLKALDPSIQQVRKIDDIEDSYVIETRDNKLIVQEGQVIRQDLLSSGTKAGLDIAYLISAIKNGRNGFYYCDEKFSYIHSDIEKAVLSVLIECLQKNEQLFFTTHNTDILDLDLPKHTFVFLKKDITDQEQPIKCISASSFLKRNTDSLRNAVDNDLFSVAPSLDWIYAIGEL